MSPVLTPTLLDPIAETFELTETELGRLFGVSRQAVAQWRERGVPSNRMAKVATVAAIADLLRHRLKAERIPGIARRPADAYGGLSMLEMIGRDGPYLRVADPDWDDPLDGRFAAERGGRWNPPESFPVVYLCPTLDVARANVYRKLAGQPYGPEDLRPGAGPVLVRTRVPEDRYLNAVSDAGLRDLGLPKTYPIDGRRRPIPRSRCQPIEIGR